MDFRILRYFLTVAKEQSFTKAAEQLHITQPTLSRQLAALEEELGVELLVRSGRHITLTDQGILFKRRALEILDLEEKNLEELKGAGYPVSIEGAERYWREDLLVQRRLYPEITSNTVVAWRRNIPNSLVVEKFIEEIKAFEGWKKN